MAASFYIACCGLLLHSLAAGQLNPSQGEVKFLESLMMEAGRQVLFPELYSTDKGMKYYQLKGQPEFEQSYTNRQLRTTKCPQDCREYKPVCGTDGKVYSSECQLLKENCDVKNVSVGEWGKCWGRHYSCPSRCLDLNAPVCGSDLKIYNNICILRKKNCGKLLKKLPLADCYTLYDKAKSEGECPEHCPPVGRPVCGSNGLIYFNECFLRKRTCREGVVQVEMESCISVPQCPQVCLPLYDPICGSDGNLYTNYCRMLQSNCGRGIKKMPLSFCSAEVENLSHPKGSLKDL